MVQQTYKQGRQWLEEADVVDVDQEADRTDPDGPVRGQDQGERRRGGRLLLVEEILEQLREHLTEELTYLKREELHLRGLHLRGLQQQEEQQLLQGIHVVVV